MAPCPRATRCARDRQQRRPHGVDKKRRRVARLRIFSIAETGDEQRTGRKCEPPAAQAPQCDPRRPLLVESRGVRLEFWPRRDRKGCPRARRRAVSASARRITVRATDGFSSLTPEPPRDSDRTARGLSGTLRASEMTAETPRPCSTTAPPSATSAPRPRPPSALEPRASSGRPAHPTPVPRQPRDGIVPDAVSATDRADPDDTRTPAAPLPVATAFSRPIQPASAVRPAPAPIPAPAADARARSVPRTTSCSTRSSDSARRTSTIPTPTATPRRCSPTATPRCCSPTATTRRCSPTATTASVTLDLVRTRTTRTPTSTSTAPTSTPNRNARLDGTPRSPTPTPLSRRRSRRDRRVSPTTRVRDDISPREVSPGCRFAWKWPTSRLTSARAATTRTRRRRRSSRRCGGGKTLGRDPQGISGADVDDADPSASRRRTYSTTEAHPLHPMRGVSAEAVGADLDGPDASLGWMWTMDPLPETPEMAFDPETASRLAAEIADAVLDEEIDAALARAEEALARTEEARARASERVRAARFAIPPRISRRPWRGPPRHPPRPPRQREGEGEGEGGERDVAPGPHRLHDESGDVPAVLAAAAERSVSSPATNARRFGSFATRSDIGRGELPRIVPPAPPPDLAAAASAPAPDGPESRGPGVVRGVAALARRSKVLGRASSPRLTERDVRDGEAPSPTRASGVPCVISPPRVIRSASGTGDSPRANPQPRPRRRRRLCSGAGIRSRRAPIARREWCPRFAGNFGVCATNVSNSSRGVRACNCAARWRSGNATSSKFDWRSSRRRGINTDARSDAR